MENVTLIMGSVLPVPAVKGGAVENLIENLIKEQEINKKIKLNVMCCYDKDAKKIAEEKYKNTNFYFIKLNKLLNILDKIVAILAIKVLRKKNVMAYSYIFQRIAYYRKISRILKKEDCGKIILENSMGLYLGLKWKKNYKKYKNRYFYHCHNKVNTDFGCKNIIRRTNTFISVSEYMQDDLKKFVNANGKSKFVVLNNVIDSSKFNKKLTDIERKEIRQKYNIKENDKVIIFVGRLTEEKGIKQLLLAVNDLNKNDLKVLIVGSYFFNTKMKSNFQNELDNLISRNKEKIIFTGYIDYNDIYKYYKIADIAVLPSMWEEPAGLTIQEAEACGLPIITTDSGGIPEYVNSKNAIILKRDKMLISNLKLEIEKLLENKIKMKEMREESKKIASYNSTLNYYEKIIDIVES